MNQQFAATDPYIHAWRLSKLGVVRAQQRRQYMMRQNRCKNCGYFFAKYAAFNFNPRDKPRRCPHCHCENPLSHVRDPMYP